MVVAGINDKRRRGRLAVPPPTPHHLGKETRRETIRRLEKERGERERRETMAIQTFR